MTRGVETMDKVIKADDMTYLQQHGIQAMLSGILRELLKCRANDPVSFIIDSLTMGTQEAAHDPELELANWRKAKLSQVFENIDQVFPPLNYVLSYLSIYHHPTYYTLCTCARNSAYPSWMCLLSQLPAHKNCINLQL